MFTSFEKRVLVFLCFLLAFGGLLRLAGINDRIPAITQRQQPLRVNINYASLEELDKLPSIGMKTAQEIIGYRKRQGFFTSLEDLKKVRGIGDKKLNIIKEFIYLQGD